MSVGTATYVNNISLDKAERRTAGEIFTISFTPILFLSVVFAPSRPFFFLIFFPTFNGGGGDAVSRRAFYNFVSPPTVWRGPPPPPDPKDPPFLFDGSNNLTSRVGVNYRPNVVDYIGR